MLQLKHKKKAKQRQPSQQEQQRLRQRQQNVHELARFTWKFHKYVSDVDRSREWEVAGWFVRDALGGSLVPRIQGTSNQSKNYLINIIRSGQMSRRYCCFLLLQEA